MILYHGTNTIVRISSSPKVTVSGNGNCTIIPLVRISEFLDIIKISVLDSIVLKLKFRQNVGP